MEVWIYRVFFTDKISAWVLEKGTKEPIKISLFCILPALILYENTS